MPGTGLTIRLQVTPDQVLLTEQVLPYGPYVECPEKAYAVSANLYSAGRIRLR